MSLAVIGAGFGRTGTFSLKLALETLGLGPCHHMADVLSNPHQLAKWRETAHGGARDWDNLLSGYISSIDWPSAYYWRELAEYYPKAKVLLTVRGPESWYTSFASTLLETIGPDNDPESFGVRIIRNKIFGGMPDNRDHAIATYQKNTSDVQAAFSSERLLTYQLGDGWEPLCKFLGRPIPEVPFPRSNSTEEFRARILRK
jgi:Sulfotransferase domain